MADKYFTLSKEDQSEILQMGREKTGRPAHLLEKDVWVVWALNALFDSPLGTDLTFKGGTSLSKVYKIIDRFSEDIDLTFDIRKLISDITGDEEFLPRNRSQASKWSKAIRDRLPQWIAQQVIPVVQEALNRENLPAKLEIAGDDQEKLLLHYPALTRGTGYVSPVITLEFGGRATGEPHQVLPVTCDLDGYVHDITFPTASPQVMSVARTFWEKATAAHVYCVRGRFHGARYARHWHDLAAIMHSSYFDTAITDRAVALAVAEHKSHFFTAKDSNGKIIDYFSAVQGALQIVPEGESRAELADDYAAMHEDDILITSSLPFDELMLECAELARQTNAAGAANITSGILR